MIKKLQKIPSDNDEKVVLADTFCGLNQVIEAVNALIDKVEGGEKDNTLCKDCLHTTRKCIKHSTPTEEEVIEKYRIRMMDIIHTDVFAKSITEVLRDFLTSFLKEIRELK
jgi:hypothetical protein